MAEYSFKIIESKWQKRWQSSNIHSLDNSSDTNKYYCLTSKNKNSGAKNPRKRAFLLYGVIY